MKGHLIVRKFVNCPCQILFVCNSVVPAKRAERRDVTDLPRKVDDVLPGNRLPQLRKRKPEKNTILNSANLCPESNVLKRFALRLSHCA